MIDEPVKGDAVEHVFAQILSNQGIKRDDIVSRTGKSLATVKRALEELTSGDAPRVVYRGSNKTGGYYPLPGRSGNWEASPREAGVI